MLKCEFQNYPLLPRSPRNQQSDGKFNIEALNFSFCQRESARPRRAPGGGGGGGGCNVITFEFLFFPLRFQLINAKQI